MRIGLLVTSLGNFGQKGFYNAQEIGLSKALGRYFDEVIIYKLIPQSQPRSRETIKDSTNVTLNLIPAKGFGINGLFNLRELDENLDVLIHFSDTQLILPSVYRWAKKNHVAFYPYIGVLESHSTSGLKKFIINALFKRNLRVYDKCYCLAKTPAVENKLHRMGVKRTLVTPVGLDLELLHQDTEDTDIVQLKHKYGCKAEDKILIFIGRLIEEKQPLRMLEIFSEIHEKNQNYKLVMVGKGPLQETVNEKISVLGITDAVMQIEQIPNCDIWELYQIADCFINLNQQEIFGMAILEAMYYGCKVVAWKAPGPELIIEDGVSGYLVDSNTSVVNKIMETNYTLEKGKQRVLENFTWDNMAKRVFALVTDGNHLKCGE